MSGTLDLMGFGQGFELGGDGERIGRGRGIAILVAKPDLHRHGYGIQALRRETRPETGSCDHSRLQTRIGEGGNGLSRWRS